MANEIKYGTTKLTYTEESVVNVKVSDGTVLSFPNETKSTVNNAKVLAAYVKLKGQYTPPVLNPPVIIVPPAPGEGKQISLKDFAQLKDVSDTKFNVAAGSLSSGVSLSNLKNVTIEGLGAVQLTNSGITLGGKIIGLTVSGFNLSNIPGYQITYPGLDKVEYDGKEGSFIDGITLQNIVSSNGGRLFHVDGNIRKGGVYDGVVMNFKLLNSVVKDCPNPGSVVYLGNGFYYEIGNVMLTNINRIFTPTKTEPNGIHNGLFHLKGFGKMYGVKASNHQGNVGRFWPHSLDGKGLVEAYDNIILNSLKFSAFELQTPADMVANGAKKADAYIHDNIAGQLSTSKDWDGQMLDLYNFNGGELKYTNNKGYDLVTSKNDQWHTVAGTKMINNMSDVKITESGNVYYSTKAEALKAIPSLSLT